MNEKMREFVKGMLPGLPGKPHPMANKEPVAYLYNGVRLPKLPEWDKTAYPYAVIYTSSTENHYGLIFSNVPFYATDAPLIVRKKDGLGTYYGSGANYACYLEDTAWEFFRYIAIYEDKPFGVRALWANYDMLNYDDDTSLFLAATDPIPVYE